jgi:hypothetical protein
MRAVFTLPSGLRVKTATQRDYVLICEGSAGAWIERRSDRIETIQDHAGKMRRTGHPARRYSGDTTTTPGKLRELP